MNNEWETPDDLFDTLDKEFGFTFDLCANFDNTKCKTFSSDLESIYGGLPEESSDSYWMNPPYSRGNIDSCMEIAFQLGKTNTVVCLVRFDPSAKWFQRWVDGKAGVVRMLDRRVKFKGAPSAYNFPCCVVVYEGDPEYIFDRDLSTFYTIWGWK